MPPILGLDIGDCLSTRLDDRTDSEIWRAMSPGAWPFLALYTKKYGPEHIHIISRTNRGTWHNHHRRLGKVEACVARFVR